MGPKDAITYYSGPNAPPKASPLGHSTNLPSILRTLNVESLRSVNPSAGSSPVAVLDPVSNAWSGQSVSLLNNRRASTYNLFNELVRGAGSCTTVVGHMRSIEQGLVTELIDCPNSA